MPKKEPGSQKKGLPGRPTSYTTEVAEEICLRIADGEYLVDICEDDHLPTRVTVHLWVIQDREGFSYMYGEARRAQALGWAEEILEIADNVEQDFREDEDGKRTVNKEYVQRSRLRVDTRKWLLGRVLAKVYGDKLTVGGDDKNPLRVRVENMTDEELTEKAKQITNRLAAVKNNGDIGD